MVSFDVLRSQNFIIGSTGTVKIAEDTKLNFRYLPNLALLQENFNLLSSHLHTIYIPEFYCIHPRDGFALCYPPTVCNAAFFLPFLFLFQDRKSVNVFPGNEGRKEAKEERKEGQGQ